MNMLVTAWEQVTPKTMKNCWKKGAFITATENDAEGDISDKELMPAAPTGISQEMRTTGSIWIMI